MSKKKIVKVIPDATAVEVTAPVEEIKPVDVHGDVVDFLSGKGVVHVDAINVPHDKSDVDVVINHLKLTGKVNADASGRVWLA